MAAVFFTAEDRALAEAVRRMNAANPFLPERIAAERAALGPAFRPEGEDWNQRPPGAQPVVNHVLITARCGELIERVRAGFAPADATAPGRGAAGPSRRRAPGPTELQLYEEVVGFWLYQRFAARFDAAIIAALEGRAGDARVSFFPAFRAEAERCFAGPTRAVLERQPAEHLFATAFQIRRAFHAIFRSLVGGSAPLARLRAAIWQSLFTHDLRRYRYGLHDRMGDFATLITGPSGTGKELVARALALSRYVPFDPRRGGFTADFAEGFFALNLAALSPTLIESELFGHRRGAFTGALADRAGWMEVCPKTGAVFLDEIGEVEPVIQVKLLRVLQTRTFQRLGDTESREFPGKIIAATNRNLPSEIRAGRFREDFYYRLCSDLLTTVSLRTQLDARSDDLVLMVTHIARRLLRDEEVAPFTREAVAWIGTHLGDAYAWPGNFRELEQCVRNLLLRGEYRPAGPLQPQAGESAASEGEGGPLAWIAGARAGRLTAEAVLRGYTRQIHAEARTIEETARRLDLDRRTVRARLRD